MTKILYRGHKDRDYLRTKYKALSFTENKEVAKAYGLGSNDQGNPDVQDGYVTEVEFHGNIATAQENGLGNIDKHLANYLNCDAVRFKDGVITVLDQSKLKNPLQKKASEI